MYFLVEFAFFTGFVDGGGCPEEGADTVVWGGGGGGISATANADGNEDAGIS